MNQQGGELRTEAGSQRGPSRTAGCEIRRGEEVDGALTLMLTAANRDPRSRYRTRV